MTALVAMYVGVLMVQACVAKRQLGVAAAESEPPEARRP